MKHLFIKLSPKITMGSLFCGLLLNVNSQEHKSNNSTRLQESNRPYKESSIDYLNMARALMLKEKYIFLSNLKKEFTTTIPLKNDVNEASSLKLQKSNDMIFREFIKKHNTYYFVKEDYLLKNEPLYKLRSTNSRYLILSQRNRELKSKQTRILNNYINTKLASNQSLYEELIELLSTYKSSQLREITTLLKENSVKDHNTKLKIIMEQKNSSQLFLFVLESFYLQKEGARHEGTLILMAHILLENEPKELKVSFIDRKMEQILLFGYEEELNRLLDEFIFVTEELDKRTVPLQDLTADERRKALVKLMREKQASEWFSQMRVTQEKVNEYLEKKSIVFRKSLEEFRKQHVAFMTKNLKEEREKELKRVEQELRKDERYVVIEKQLEEMNKKIVELKKYKQKLVYQKSSKLKRIGLSSDPEDDSSSINNAKPDSFPVNGAELEITRSLKPYPERVRNKKKASPLKHQHGPGCKH